MVVCCFRGISKIKTMLRCYFGVIALARYLYICISCILQYNILVEVYIYIYIYISTNKRKQLWIETPGIHR